MTTPNLKTNHRYFWKIWSAAQTLSISTFGLSSFFDIPARIKFSIGIWARVVVDDVSEQKSSSSNVKPVYRQLDDGEFRLLELYADDKASFDEDVSHISDKRDPQLRARLIHTQLSSFYDKRTHKYEALSYVWGPPVRSQTVEIDGRQCRITEALAECLIQLRTRAKAGPLLLWIDALCIDQDNVIEKSQQVQLMPTIYRTAQRVLVWLGPESNDSGVGMDILKYLSCRTYPSLAPPWSLIPPNMAFAGLSDIMDRPWFRRAWVVQEAVLSQEVQVMCGTRYFSWESFSTASVRSFERMIKYAEISPSWEQAGLSKINMEPLLELFDFQTGQQLDRSHGSSHRMSRDLLDMAHSLRHKLASDRRDMLFAVAGMAEDGYGEKNYRPNYDWSTEEAYQHLLECVYF